MSEFREDLEVNDDEIVDYGDYSELKESNAEEDSIEDDVNSIFGDEDAEEEINEDEVELEDEIEGVFGDEEENDEESDSESDEAKNSSSEFTDEDLDNLGLDDIDFINTATSANIDDVEEVDFDDNSIDDIDASDISELDNIVVDDSDEDDVSVVDKSELYDEEPDNNDISEMDFISDSGNIIVQDKDDSGENGFGLVYVNLQDIAVTPRIRKLKSVEGLVQSIHSTGLLSPLVVAPLKTKGAYVLIDGYRRLQACARAGKNKVPCIVNNKVSTLEISILESMYNHSQAYSIQEQIDYIKYLETEKGIMNPSMIEYLLQMESGDYTKLKDILNDDDDDIVSKLLNGTYNIATAFKKLEQRRKKETVEEKEDKKAAKVYEDEAESGADQIAGAGEEADGSALTDEQIASITINAESLDDDIEDTSLSEMIDEDSNIEGFQPHKQKVGEREFVDPVIKKSVMTRDNSTCQCCKRGGEQYVDILDFHHILPVFLGGVDNVENGVMLCVSCHRLVHLYSTGDLHIDKALLEGSYNDLSEDQKSRYENEEIFEDEKKRFKRIIKLGSVIRKGIAARGMNREQYKKEHSNAGIGRRRPGVNAEQEKT